MKTAFRNAVLFTLIVLAVLATADVIVAGFYQFTVAEHLLVHGIVLAAVVVLCGAGAFGAFAAFRARVPTKTSVAISALLFSAATFFAFVWAFGLGGVVASLAWLPVGAAFFAGSSVLVGASSHDG